nr:MAG TPA: hypothetical protein [Caudoviricetes sp.]
MPRTFRPGCVVGIPRSRAVGIQMARTPRCGFS